MKLLLPACQHSHFCKCCSFWTFTLFQASWRSHFCSCIVAVIMVHFRQYCSIRGALLTHDSISVAISQERGLNSCPRHCTRNNGPFQAVLFDSRRLTYSWFHIHCGLKKWAKNSCPWHCPRTAVRGCPFQASTVRFEEPVDPQWCKCAANYCFSIIACELVDWRRRATGFSFFARLRSQKISFPLQCNSIVRRQEKTC